MRLKTLLGDYPVTKPLKEGRVAGSLVQLDYADVKLPNTAFKRVVRDLEFDVAEIAIVTYLMARAHGKPLVLLPAVLFGRFQHPYLVSASGLKPKAARTKIAISVAPLSSRPALMICTQVVAIIPPKVT